MLAKLAQRTLSETLSVKLFVKTAKVPLFPILVQPRADASASIESTWPRLVSASASLATNPLMGPNPCLTVSLTVRESFTKLAHQLKNVTLTEIAVLRTTVIKSAMEEKVQSIKTSVFANAITSSRPLRFAMQSARSLPS